MSQTQVKKLLTTEQAFIVRIALTLISSLDATCRIELENRDLSIQRHHTSHVIEIVRLIGPPNWRNIETYKTIEEFSDSYMI